MEKVILTNMCMIMNEETNQVVVQERIKDWKGIAFPGGKVNEGEAIIRSTIREIKEETGLNISNLILCGIKDWYDKKKKERYIVFLLKTSSFTGNLISETDEGKVFWCDLEKMKKMKLSPDFKEMFNMFMSNNAYHEFFYDDTEDDDETIRWKKCFF